MRTFIAIDLPGSTKEALGRLQNKLKDCGADVNWVESKNIHITLKFLGEVDTDTSIKVVSAIEDIASANKCFKIKLSGCGVFPKPSFPKIIWVGIETGANQTRDIAGKLEEKTGEFGILKEARPFSPHITIGRTKSQQNRDKLIESLEKSGNYFEDNKLEFDVTRITLFKSTLKPAGPVYEALKEVNLITA